MSKRMFYEVTMISTTYESMSAEVFIVKAEDAADAYYKAACRLEADYEKKYGKNVWTTEKPYASSVEAHTDWRSA